MVGVGFDWRREFDGRRREDGRCPRKKTERGSLVLDDAIFRNVRNSLAGRDVEDSTRNRSTIGSEVTADSSKRSKGENIETHIGERVSQRFAKKGEVGIEYCQQVE